MEEGVEIALQGDTIVDFIDFTEYVVTSLARILSVRYVAVAIPDESNEKRLKVLKMWENDHIREPFEYPLTDTPCERLYAEKKSIIIRDGLQNEYPQNQWFSASGLDSYYGIPLFDSEQSLIGHIYLMDNSPVFMDHRHEILLKLFARLTEGKLERHLKKQSTRSADYFTNNNQELLNYQQAVAELDTFFYKASHDIRTPITAIEGVYNIIKVDPALAKNPVLKLLEKQIIKIKALNASIIEVGGIRSRMREFVPLNLNVLVSEVVSSINTQKEVVPTIDIHPDLQITSDRYLLSMILKSIITNSFQYLDESKNNPGIDISASEAEGRIIMSIQDNGTGINPHLAKKLFSMFYRADTNRSGFGLGLYKAKMAADKLGIDLAIDSIENEGTIVRISC